MTAIPVSRAWQLDQAMRAIIGRMVRGEASDADRSELQHLIRQRADNMLPRDLRERRQTNHSQARK